MTPRPVVGRRARLAGLLLIFAASEAPAHDFWIEPSTFAPAAKAPVAISLRVGEELRGELFARDPSHIARFALIGRDGESAVLGRAGRNPAGVATPTAAGNHWIVYESQPRSVELGAEAFEKYLAEEGLDGVIAARAERDESAATGRELYSRAAKALLRVGREGAGTGLERPVGLPLEIVVASLTSPPWGEVGQRPGEGEAHDASECLSSFPRPSPQGGEGGVAVCLDVAILFRGQPLEGVLVAALDAADPKTPLRARSDADGRVRFRLPRPGQWLVRAVHMVRLDGEPRADWRSFWASLTLEIPPASRLDKARRGP